jgi:hypothetical protein
MPYGPIIERVVRDTYLYPAREIELQNLCAEWMDRSLPQTSH